MRATGRKPPRRREWLTTSRASPAGRVLAEPAGQHVYFVPGFCDHFDAARQLAVERQDFATLVRDSGLRVPTVTTPLGNSNSGAGAGGFILRSALAHLKLAAQLASDGLNVICGEPAVKSGEFSARALEPVWK